MGQSHCNGRKTSYKHLTYRDRLRIEIYAREKKSTLEIASLVGVSQRTVQRELKRGQVQQLDGSTWEYYTRYDADVAQNGYRARQEGKGPTLKIGHNHRLAQEIERQIQAKRSPDVIAHWTKVHEDQYGLRLCTQTIYNYLEKNVFLRVSRKDLLYGPYKRRKGKGENRPSYRNIRGKSIEDRPEQALERSIRGHWEMDLVVGKQGTTTCLLVLTERSSRKEIIRKLPNRKQESVVAVLDTLERKYGSKSFRETFQSITVDNGSEFLGWPELERSCLVKKKQRTQVYYAHPFSAFERGSNENLNRMIRRFIPKGCDISKYSKQEIQRIENWLNHYPRKILDYQTPNEVWNLVA